MKTQQTVIVKTSNHSLSVNEVSGAYVFTNEGAGALVIFTLPSASASQKVKFIVQNANGIQIDAGAWDTVNGLASISSVNVGDIIDLYCVNATEWIASIVNKNSNSAGSLGFVLYEDLNQIFYTPVWPNWWFYSSTFQNTTWDWLYSVYHNVSANGWAWASTWAIDISIDWLTWTRAITLTCQTNGSLFQTLNWTVYIPDQRYYRLYAEQVSWAGSSMTVKSKQHK